MQTVTRFEQRRHVYGTQRLAAYRYLHIEVQQRIDTD